MMISLVTDAPASTASAESKTLKPKTLKPKTLILPLTQTATAGGAAFVPPEGDGTNRDRIRHMLFGTPRTVRKTIQLLHKLGYAEPNDWSRPIATGRDHEVMAILTKRVD